MRKQTIADALHDLFITRGEAVITTYQAFRCIRVLFAEKSYQGKPLYIRKAAASAAQGRKLLHELVSRKILARDVDFPSTVYRVGDVPDQAAEEVCAVVDPFCYISHLSAMQRYGLTNRLPAELCLTVLDQACWKILRDKQMAKDYGENPPRENVIPLERVVFPERVRNRLIARHQTNHPDEGQPIRDSHARIASIGRTFHDMLEKPHLCGGMAHVLEVWEAHAKDYLEEIIAAIEQADKKIVKVRAGYILEERLGAQDQRIESWKSAAQRGGSQLLDPERPFEKTYSEKWMLSLNV